MKIVFGMLAVAAALSAAMPAVHAQAPAGPSYTVTYLEIAPAAKAEAIALLKQVAAASRKEAGNQRYDILQRVGRDNQFAILEAWADFNAAEAHRGGAALKQFRDKLGPVRVGPYDERPSLGIDVSPAAAAVAPGSIFAITHVDVTPNFTAECVAMLKKLADDARKEPGVQRIDAWQQNNRANHFTLSEAWKDNAAVDAHLVAATTRDFREKLGPMSGALFDERHYKSLE
jgi:quinol monooxygenase YgiN